MTEHKQVVWITGASSGIGKELAIQYAAKGFAVVVSARRMDLLELLQNDIKSQGGEAYAIYCDVSVSESIEKCVHQIISQYKRIDIVIANAGCGVVGFMEKLSEEDWKRQLIINVVGLAMTIKYALPELRKTKGRIALIGSVAAFVPNPMVGAYGASKAAVHNIGETLQVELLGSGVSCTTIHPGFVDSNITRVDNNGVFNPEVKDPRPTNLMWPTDKAVKEMISAIDKRTKVKVVTGHGKVFVFFGRFFPRVARFLMAKQLAKMKQS
jgi:short-subunit dehydrogenase